MDCVGGRGGGVWTPKPSGPRTFGAAKAYERGYRQTDGLLCLVVWDRPWVCDTLDDLALGGDHPCNLLDWGFCSPPASALRLRQPLTSSHSFLLHTASCYISFRGQRRPPATVYQILPEHDDDKLKHPTGQAVCLASSFPPFRPHHPVRYVCPSLKKAQQAAFAWCLCLCSHLALCLL